MKTRIILLIALALGIVGTCTVIAQKVTPSGPVTKVEHNIRDFSAIQTQSGIDVLLTMGNEEKVVLEANENLHQYIEISKDGNALKIRFKSNLQISFKNTLIKVHVTAKNISDLSASGGADIRILNALEATNLKINASGGSDVYGEVKCVDMNVNISGGADAKLTGKVENLNVNASGGADFGGFDLIAKRVNCNASGGSDAYVYASESLKANASGGSDIYYKGTANVTKNTSGGSDIKAR